MQYNKNIIRRKAKPRSRKLQFAGASTQVTSSSEGSSPVAGVTSYDALTGLPTIDNVELKGDLQSYSDLGLVNNTMIELVNVGSSSSPVYALKAKYPLFSTGEISAFGYSSGSTPSGVGSVEYEQTQQGGQQIGVLTVDGVTYPISAQKGDTVSVIKNYTGGTQIATLRINGVDTILEAPQGGGSGGSSVSYDSSVTSGNLLGTLTIDGTAYKIYAPASSSAVSSVAGYTGAVTAAQLKTALAYTASDVGALPSSTVIPTKVSQLTNDSKFLSSITKAMVEAALTGNITSHTHSQYLTSHQDISGKVDKVTGKGLSTNDFTTVMMTNVENNTTARHTHTNKAILDAIASAPLTSHQSIFTLTIQKNGVEMGKFAPKTEDKIINIPDVASAAALSGHTADKTNPHAVTKAQVGLGNCDNTADSSKNVLSATKWTTARNFTIKDASQTNSGTATSVDGSEAETLLLPATIKVTSLQIGGATLTWDATNGVLICDKPIVSYGEITAFK